MVLGGQVIRRRDDENVNPSKRQARCEQPPSSRYTKIVNKGTPWADADGTIQLFDVYSNHGLNVLTLTLGKTSNMPPGVQNECPISFEGFETVGVDFLEGEVLCPDQPDLCIATLPCKHSFNAVGIIYHFAMSNMRCPVCRQGLNKKLRMTSIPSHLRKRIKQKVSLQIVSAH